MTTPTDANQEAVARALAELSPEAIPEIEILEVVAVEAPAITPTEPFVQTEEEIDDTPTPVATPAPTMIEDPIAEEPQQVQDVEEIIIPERKQQKVTVTEKVSIDGELEPEDDKLCLPSNFDAETVKTLQNLPNVDILSSAQGRQWTETVNQGLNNSTFDSQFIPTLEEEEADFGQSVDFNGQPLDGRQVRFKQTEGQSLKGERAALRMMKHRGIGTIFQAPLWHTGIWLTLKAPSENELI